MYPHCLVTDSNKMYSQRRVRCVLIRCTIFPCYPFKFYVHLSFRYRYYIGYTSSVVWAFNGGIGKNIIKSYREREHAI